MNGASLEAWVGLANGRLHRLEVWADFRADVLPVDEDGGCLRDLGIRLHQFLENRSALRLLTFGHLGILDAKRSAAFGCIALVLSLGVHASQPWHIQGLVGANPDHALAKLLQDTRRRFVEAIVPLAIPDFTIFFLEHKG